MYPLAARLSNIEAEAGERSTNGLRLLSPALLSKLLQRQIVHLISEGDIPGQL
jgi:hypothetical protein